MNSRPPVTDEDEGCGTFGCVALMGLVLVLVYGYAYDLTVRQVSLMALGVAVGVPVSWLLCDTVAGVWRKWRGRKHGGA